VAKSAAPAGAVEIRMTAQEYEAALRHVFPSHALNRTASMIDGIAANAAQTVSKDPRFLSAWATNDMKTAGNIFHSFAAQEARTIPPSAVADGWTLTAERTIKSGKGGSRADIFLEGPDKEIIEIDWKTTGTSALASKSQMAKHAGHIRVELGGKLTVQESRSWVDYVRPLLPWLHRPPISSCVRRQVGRRSSVQAACASLTPSSSLRGDRGRCLQAADSRGACRPAW